MIHVVQRMKVFAIQSLTKKMWLDDAIARKILAVDDVIRAWKDFGIWMQTIRWVVNHAHVIHSEQLEIWAAICIRANVYANVW